MKTSIRLAASLAGAALTLALGACGGGGGGGGNDGGGTPPPPPPPPPANLAPTITGAAPVSIHAGSTYEFTPDASDPDGDTLTFAIANAPAWAAFDPTTGTLSGTPFAAHLGDYPDIVISVSDGEASVDLPAFSLVVLPQLLGSSNFIAEGQTFPTDDGYQSVGDLVLETGERTMRFEDADLDLSFDSDGKLIDISGETFIPKNPADNVTIDSPVRAVVGLMRGADINADEAFGIRLQDDTYYFVFYVSSALDITIGDRNDPSVTSHITLETPIGGEILLITDPTDPFFYRFGSQALIGEGGRGESANGLIPYVPQLAHPEIQSFNGHIIDKGAIGVGVKIFDFFELSGYKIERNPGFVVIDWDDPFASTIEFMSGMNGNADFALSVLGVGLFSFELAETSAMLDVRLDRQSMAMRTRIAPDVSWLPSWFPFVPATEVVGDWHIEGDGTYSASLSGSYRSTVPPADIQGTMAISDQGTILSGTTRDGTGALTMSAEFASNVTTVRVETSGDFAAGIKSAVTGALDRELAAAEDALQDLENAIADYELEVSLRGLRSALPTIADNAIVALNGIPGTVRDAVDSATVSYIDNACVTVIVTVCLADLVDENAIGDSTGATARSQAETAIEPYVDAMEELKQQALNGDDESLRESLRLALLAAYNHRVFSRRFTISYSFPSPFGTVTVYDQTFTRRVIEEDLANQILAAANNVYRIQETSDIMVSAQAVYDAFPAEETISTVRQEVEDGLAQIPSVEGMGATIAGGAVDPFVTIDGTDYPVGFNVLNPGEAIAGVGELIADRLLGR